MRDPQPAGNIPSGPGSIGLPRGFRQQLQQNALYGNERQRVVLEKFLIQAMCQPSAQNTPDVCGSLQSVGEIGYPVKNRLIDFEEQAVRAGAKRPGVLVARRVVAQRPGLKRRAHGSASGLRILPLEDITEMRMLAKMRRKFKTTFVFVFDDPEAVP